MRLAGLSFRRHLLPIACLCLGAFLSAHIVNAFVADRLLPLEIPTLSEPPQNPVSSRPTSSDEFARNVMNSGLFLLPPPSESASGGTGKDAATLTGPPLEAGKKLLLLGTALGASGTGSAILQDRSNQQQKSYHLHDRVPNVGELIAIEKDRVQFEDRGQQEWLELGVLDALRESRKLPPVPLAAGGGRPIFSELHKLPQAVRVSMRTADQSADRIPKTIDRRELSEVLSDIPLLLLQGDPVPALVEGRFNGVLLNSVRFTGFFFKIGLQEGDVIKRINGVELRNPGMLISLLQQMKDEQRIKIDLLRSDKPRTFTYDVR